MYCDNCGNIIDDNSNFCSYCGVKVKKTVPKCSNCGAEVKEYDTVCDNCGQTIEKSNNQSNSESSNKNANQTYTSVYNATYSSESGNSGYNNQSNDSTTSSNIKRPKSKLVAGILGILVGGLGVHRFYLGYIGIGLIQILLTFLTFGLASLWGFIEGILILCGTGITTDADGVQLID